MACNNKILQLEEILFCTYLDGFSYALWFGMLRAAENPTVKSHNALSEGSMTNGVFSYFFERMNHLNTATSPFFKHRKLPFIIKKCDILA